MDYKANEVSQVLLSFVVTFLVLENVRSCPEKQLKKLGDHVRLLDLLYHILLVWRQDNYVDYCLCQEVE